MISVILPVLNEEKLIRSTLLHLRIMKGAFETIIVDGGSSDKTVEIAKRHATVVASKKGRARQMNIGAGRASGDVLFFLHIDCLPETGAFLEIEDILRNRGVVGGALRYDIDEPSVLYRNHAFWSNLRARVSGIHPGDHGLFVRREVFDRIGGFPDIPLMEDVALCNKLNKEGRLVQAKSRIFSSPRRFKKQGFAKTVLKMWTNRLFYAIGVPPERLSDVYKDVR